MPPDIELSNTQTENGHKDGQGCEEAGNTKILTEEPSEMENISTEVKAEEPTTDSNKPGRAASSVSEKSGKTEQYTDDSTQETRPHQMTERSAHGTYSYFSVFRGQGNSNSRRSTHDYVRDLEHELENCRKDNNKLADNLRALELQLEELNEAHKTVCKEKDEATLIVQGMQEQAFTLLDQAEWQPEEDDKIRRQLKSLEKEAKDWSKHYGLSRLSTSEWTTGSLEDRKNLYEKLKPFCAMTPEGIDVLMGKDMDTKAVPMLLSAWLLDFIYESVMVKPLYFLGARYDAMAESAAKANDETLQPVSEEHWSSLILELTKGNAKEAHACRAQLLRLLEPKGSSVAKISHHRKRARVEATLARTLDARDKTCEQLADEFWQDAAPLIRTLDKEHSKSLKKIFLKAADISSKLWTQKRFFVPKYLEDVLGEFGRVKNIVQAHPLHNSKLEEDPLALDKCPIMLLTQPAFLAYGDSAGTDYSVCRVLMAGTAWMG